MKYNYTICRFIVLALIVSFTGCSQFQLRNNAKEIRKSKFAFVFDSVNRLGLDSVSLYGHHPLKQKVYLLDKDQNQICEAITDEHRKYEGDSNWFPFTTLKGLTLCRSGGYSVATFEPVLDYKIINLRPITDSDLIHSLNKLIRNSSAVKNLNRKAQGLVPGDEDYPINDLLPKVLRFALANAQGYIVAYEAGEKYPHGPRFVVLGESVHALTGWCSYPYIRFFILNDTFYVESGSGCCSCGITIMELYKIDRNNVELIFDDPSESD